MRLWILAPVGARVSTAGLGIAALLLGASGATGQNLDQVLQIRGQTHTAARVSQQKIDRLTEQTQDLLQQYRTENQQIDSLRVYNAQLEKLIRSQDAEKVKLQQEIDSVTETRRGILPLMQQMVDMLAQVIEADVPFLLEERRNRVARLRDLIIDSSVQDGEKYRKIIEAYSIENGYGHTIGAYQDELEVDGELRDVDFLRIGRVALFYQTRDQDLSGVWDVASNGWAEVDSGYADAIAQGFKVARNQAPPNLLLLPIQAAEDTQ